MKKTYDHLSMIQRWELFNIVVPEPLPGGMGSIQEEVIETPRGSCVAVYAGAWVVEFWIETGDVSVRNNKGELAPINLFTFFRACAKLGLTY